MMDWPVAPSCFNTFSFYHDLNRDTHTHTDLEAIAEAPQGGITLIYTVSVEISHVGM